MTDSEGYLYRVKSIEPQDPLTNVAPISAYSVAAVRSLAAGLGGTIQPAANLAVDSAAKNSLTLTWDDTSNGETGYEVWRSVEGGSFAFYQKLTGANVTQWIDSGLKASKAYSYKLRTLGSTTSGFSNTASGTTLAGAPTVIRGDLETSKPNVVVAEFDQPISAVGGTLDPSAIAIYSLTGGRQLVNGIEFSALDVVGDRVRVQLASSTQFPNGVLPDGNYEIIIRGDAVANAAGQTISDAEHPDIEGIGETFFFAGDFDHDRSVDFDDLVILAQNYNTSGRSFAQGDANYDGTVDFSDLVLVAQRYQATYPAPLGGVSTLQASTGPLATPGLDPLHTATPSNAAYLHWEPPSAAEGSFVGYKVWRSIDGVNFKLVATLPFSADDYIDRGLLEGERYSYRVRPYRADGSFGTSTNKAAAVTTLRGPQLLDAEAIGSGTVRVSWLDNSSNEDRFDVVVLDEEDHVLRTVSFPANSTSGVIEGLSEGTSYKFRVSAATGAAVGRMAIEKSVLTWLAQPTQVVFTPDGSSSAAVSWTDNSSRESGYTVRWLVHSSYTDANGNFIAAGTVLGATSVGAGPGTGSTRSVNITGLPAGVDVFFDVTATSTAGAEKSSATTQSTQSTLGTTSAPAPVKNVTAEVKSLDGSPSDAADEFNKNSSEVEIKWEDDQPGVSHYYVWMESPKRALLGAVAAETGQSGKRRFTAKALDPNEEYTFSVQPEVPDAGEVGATNSQSAKTGLQHSDGEYPGFWFGEVKSSKVTLRWTPIDNAAATFELLRKEPGSNELIKVGTFGSGSTKKEVTGLQDDSDYSFVLRTIYHDDRFVESWLNVHTPADTEDEKNRREAEENTIASLSGLSFDELFDHGLQYESSWGSDGAAWYLGSDPGRRQWEQFPDAHSARSPYLPGLPTDTLIFRERFRFVGEFNNRIVQARTTVESPVAATEPNIEPPTRYTFRKEKWGADDVYIYNVIAPHRDLPPNFVSNEAHSWMATPVPDADDVWRDQGEFITPATGYNDDGIYLTNPTGGSTVRFTVKSIDSHGVSRRLVVKTFTAPEYTLDSEDSLDSYEDAAGDDDDENERRKNHSPRPSNLNVIKSTADTNTIQLYDNARNEQGLEVERSRDGVHWARIWHGGAVDGDHRLIEFDDPGLEPGVEYEYRARAFKYTRSHRPADETKPYDKDTNALPVLEFSRWSEITDESKGLTDAEIGVWAETPKAQEGQSTPAKFGLYTLGEFDVNNSPGHGYDVQLQVPTTATASYFSDYTFAQGAGLPTEPPATTPINFSLLVNQQLQMLDVNIGASEGEVEGDERLVLKVMPEGPNDPVYVPASPPDATIKIEDGMSVGLHIDVDNNDTIDAADDAAKNNAAIIGAYTDINNIDRNDNGIPDYADGYTGGNVTWGTATNGTTFEPVILRVANVPNRANATVRFDYSATDPAAVQEVANPSHASFPAERAYDYVLPAGMFRLWIKDGGVLRNATSIVNGGDFIPAGVDIPLSTLIPADASQVYLYLEAVRHNGPSGLNPAPSFFAKQPVKAIVSSGLSSANSTAPAVPVYTDSGWKALTYELSRFNPNTFAPAAGWNAINRGNLIDIYEYYDQLYTKGYQQSVSTGTVNKMQWAGLAKVAGLKVVAGLDIDAVGLMTATFNSVDSIAHALLGGFTLPSTSAQIYAQASVTVPLLHNQIMLMAKEIFDDIGWQHTAYLIGGIGEIDRLDSAGLIPPSIVNVPAAWHLIDSGTTSGVWNGTTVITNQEQVGTLARGYGVIATMPLMTYNGVTFTGDMAVTGMSEFFRPLDSAMTFLEFNQAFGSSVGFLTTGTLRWGWIVHVLGAWQAKAESQRFAIVGTPFP